MNLNSNNANKTNNINNINNKTNNNRLDDIMNFEFGNVINNNMNNCKQITISYPNAFSNNNPI